jgi:4-amino-4-deoxy-L-arabinose transferase-like glycosyltransferase
MSNQIETNNVQVWSKAPVVLLLLTVVFSLLYFISNLNADLIAAGEARAAEIAREMLERGNFILPSLNHVVSAESLTKPPLYHWMLIVVAAPFDWPNWAVRLTSVMASFGSIWLVFLFGRQMFGFRAGVFSALVLSTSILFLENSAAARMDVFFSFLILAAIYCFWMAINRDQETKWIYGFYALSGLGVLTKGPVGVLFPLAIAALLLVNNPGTRNWRQFVPLKGILIFFALVLPWYVLLAMTAPSNLAANFLFGQLAQWWAGSSNTAAKGGAPLTYYLPHILIGLFPWSLFLPAAIVVGIGAARQGDNPGIKSMLFWFLGGLILFSLGGKKAARYLLPIMAPFALVMGFYWDKVAEAISKRHGLALNISSAMVLLFVVVLALLLAGIYTDTDWVMQWLFKGRNRGGASQLSAALDLLLEHPLAVAATIGAVVFAAMLAMIGSVKRNMYLLVFGLAGVIWSLVWPYTLTVRPVLKQQLSPRAAAEMIASMLPKDTVIYGGGSGYEHAMRWYLNRNIQLESQNQLYNRVLQHPSSWVLLTENDPLQDELLATDRKSLQWKVDYYYVSLFPGTQQETIDR